MKCLPELGAESRVPVWHDGLRKSVPEGVRAVLCWKSVLQGNENNSRGKSIDNDHDVFERIWSVERSKEVHCGGFSWSKREVEEVSFSDRLGGAVLVASTVQELLAEFVEVLFHPRPVKPLLANDIGFFRALMTRTLVKGCPPEAGLAR
jgi:hypothetical protein